MAKLTMLQSASGVTSTAVRGVAAAATAAQSRVKKFDIYRWNPEVPGQKPYKQTYEGRYMAEMMDESFKSSPVGYYDVCVCVLGN